MRGIWRWRSRETISRWSGLEITVARILFLVAINSYTSSSRFAIIAMNYIIGGKDFLVINEVREPCFCYTNHVVICSFINE